MSCAAAKSSRVIHGKFSLKPESFSALRNACGFHNVDTRIGAMYLADTTSPGDYRWEAHSLETRPDIVEAAVANPEKHFGVKQLLTWEAHVYHAAKSSVHRAVALGASVMNGNERYFLAIQRQNKGLKTLGFILEQSLPLLPDIYYLRTW